MFFSLIRDNISRNKNAIKTQKIIGNAVMLLFYLNKKNLINIKLYLKSRQADFILTNWIF